MVACLLFEAAGMPWRLSPQVLLAQIGPSEVLELTKQISAPAPAVLNIEMVIKYIGVENPFCQSKDVAYLTRSCCIILIYNNAQMNEDSLGTVHEWST